MIDNGNAMLAEKAPEITEPLAMLDRDFQRLMDARAIAQRILNRLLDSQPANPAKDAVSDRPSRTSGLVGSFMSIHDRIEETTEELISILERIGQIV